MIHESYTGTKTSVFVLPQVHEKPIFLKISTLKLVMVTVFTGHLLQQTKQEEKFPFSGKKVMCGRNLSAKP